MPEIPKRLSPLGKSMRLTASVTRDGDWFVAQCLEVDVCSQGESREAALKNLAEALELYFEDEGGISEASRAKRGWWWARRLARRLSTAGRCLLEDPYRILTTGIRRGGTVYA